MSKILWQKKSKSAHMAVACTPPAGIQAPCAQTAATAVLGGPQDPRQSCWGQPRCQPQPLLPYPGQSAMSQNMHAGVCLGTHKYGPLLFVLGKCMFLLVGMCPMFPNSIIPQLHSASSPSFPLSFILSILKRLAWL